MVKLNQIAYFKKKISVKIILNNTEYFYFLFAIICFSTADVALFLPQLKSK